jgi:hypothetical protein
MRSIVGMATQPLSSKTFDPALQAALSPSVTYIIPIIEHRVVSIRMCLEIGRHAGDRVRKVAGVDVFERPFFAPSEMLVTRQCVPIMFSTAGE